MERILERYERYSYAERLLVAADIDSQVRWTLEHVKLQARLEVLDRTQRHFMGEDLDTLSVKELQSLEHQLDSALKHIRSRKNQLMNDSISELQTKDKALLEENKLLAKKIKEKEGKALARHAQLEQQNQDPAQIRFTPLSLRKTHHLFFNPLPLSTQGHAHLCPLFNPFLPLFAPHSQIHTPSLVFKSLFYVLFFLFDHYTIAPTSSTHKYSPFSFSIFYSYYYY
ncbi:agamous-like MADS-box protein AGL8 homolog [Camellia sinensis]|uniref:agamous-like MADS-box protein AGL8 homolog n=1 Tax=Camellia sinensis TaxID=4442 RepID=UPI0010356E19|nr:agamous-like MADS-box protein AGL8 homolog [Camellia sinensis]